jgi:hypothetical protein
MSCFSFSFAHSFVGHQKDRMHVSTVPTATAYSYYPIAQTPYQYSHFERISSIAEIWDSLLIEPNIYLHSTYLSALEISPPNDMKFHYLVVFQGNRPVGLIYLQIFHLSIEKSLQKKGEEEVSSMCFVRKLKEALKSWIAKKAEYDLLICGNLLLTGEYGFAFLPEIEPTKAIALVQQGIEDFQKRLDKQQRTQLVLIKDFPTDQAAPLQTQLQSNQYTQFQIQPCMRMELPAAWKGYEDYLAAMSSKYRVRAKRAAKKGKDLVRKELSLAEIQAAEQQIYALYSKVASNVNFNAFTLHPSYFTTLKRQLGEGYRLFGYYLEGEMVAFYTGIVNGEELSAHFLGLDERFNHSHQAYLNILYDLVQLGLSVGAKAIDFARTALEIKSSVGAVAQEMYCYIKHRNTFSNKFVQFLLEYMNPKEQWQPRHPFKEGAEEQEEG